MKLKNVFNSRQKEMDYISSTLTQKGKKSRKFAFKISKNIVLCVSKI